MAGIKAGFRTKAQIESFVENLRKGAVAFEDEYSEGRSKSLGASLSYGFEHAFSEDERKVLALLHLFQGFVSEGTMRMMGRKQLSWSIPELRQFDSKRMIELLNKMAEIGLLSTIGNGGYNIHPALPWFIKNQFDGYYSPRPEESEARRKVIRAFVKSMGDLGDYYHDQYGFGDTKVINLLRSEMPNLLYARLLARKNGWWDALGSIMQGLHIFYFHTGGRPEWKRLVEEILPDFFDT